MENTSVEVSCDRTKRSTLMIFMIYKGLVEKLKKNVKIKK